MSSISDIEPQYQDRVAARDNARKAAIEVQIKEIELARRLAPRRVSA